MTLLRISLMAVIPIGLLLLGGRLLHRWFRAELKYWLWLVISLRLLFPVSVTLPEQAAQLPVVYQAVSVEQRITAISNGSAPASETVTTDTQAPAHAQSIRRLNIDWSKVFFGIWLTGLILYLCYHLLANFHFRRKLRRWHQPLRDRELRSMVLAVQEELGIRQKIQVICWEGTASPLVTGILFPILILSMEIENSESLYYILRHELTHIQRRDIAYQTVLLLASALHWFNPVVHLMRIQALHDLEVTCDAKAMAGADRQARVSYSEAMLATAISAANGPAMLSTAFLGSKKSLKLRFREILGGTPGRRKGWVVLAGVVLAVMLCGATVAMADGDADAAPAPTTAEKGSFTEAEVQEIVKSVYGVVNVGLVPRDVLDGFVEYIQASDWFWGTCIDTPYETSWIYAVYDDDRIELQVEVYDGARDCVVPMEYYLYSIEYSDGVYSGGTQGLGFPTLAFFREKLDHAELTITGGEDYLEIAKEKLLDMASIYGDEQIAELYGNSRREDAIIYWLDVSREQVTLWLYYRLPDGQVYQTNHYTKYWAYTCFWGGSGPVTDQERIKQLLSLWDAGSSAAP